MEKKTTEKQQIYREIQRRDEERLAAKGETNYYDIFNDIQDLARGGEYSRKALRDVTEETEEEFSVYLLKQEWRNEFTHDEVNREKGWLRKAVSKTREIINKYGKPAVVLLALVSLASCADKAAEDPSKMTVEQRREVIMQSDDARLTAKALDIIEKANPHMSEPLTVQEQKEVADSIVSLNDADGALEVLEEAVDVILKARNKEQFFDEVETVYAPEGCGGMKVHLMLDRKLRAPERVIRLNEEERDIFLSQFR